MPRSRCAARSSSCLASRYRPSDCLHHPILKRRVTIGPAACVHPARRAPPREVGGQRYRRRRAVLRRCRRQHGCRQENNIRLRPRAATVPARGRPPCATQRRRSCSRPPRSWLTDHRAGSAHVPAASSQHRECRRRLLFDRHRAVSERVVCDPSAGLVRSHAVLPRRSRVAYSLQPASADERAHSGAPARWRRRSFSAHSRTSLLRRSTFWSKCCAACGECRSCCASLACARLTCAAGTCTPAASSIAT